MQKETLRLLETPLRRQKTWQDGDITVLAAEITLPQCAGRDRRASRFNGYYKGYARAYLSYCEAELFPRAAERMRAAMARSAPWTCAHASLDYHVTYLHGDLLSLYSEGREEHLAPRLTIRRAETWDLYSGGIVPLSACFPPDAPIRRLLTAQAQREAEERMTAGAAVYDADYRAALHRTFSSRRFYLAEVGLHWFYPMYAMAPAGIPDFFLPYRAEGPFLPPDR